MCDVVSCKECGAVAAGGEQAKVFSSRQLKKRAAAGAAIGTTATCHKCLEEKEQAKKERGTQHRLAQQLRQEERREAAGAEAAARAQRTAGTASRPRAFMAAAAGPYLQELVADGGGWRDGDNVVRGAGAQIVSVPRTGQTRLWLECAWPVHGGGSHQLPAESRCRVWPGHRLLTSPKGRGLWVRARGLCGAP